MKHIKSIVVTFSLISLATGGFFYYRYYWQQQENQQKNAQQQTALVKSGAIQSTVSATGRVVSNLDVAIKAKASGEVVNLPYQEGDSVKKGELLVQLDPVNEQRLVQEAKVNLQAAQAKVRQAKENLILAQKNQELESQRAKVSLVLSKVKEADAKQKKARANQLFEKELVSQEELENTKLGTSQSETEVQNSQIQLKEAATLGQQIKVRQQEVNLANTQVQLSQLDLSNARQRLRETKIYAPMDGIVTALNVQKGQIISSGISNVGGGTAVLTLSDLSRIFVLATVDESDIGKVQEQQVVNITADAFPEQKFQGQVERIAPKGINVSNVVTFEVRIEVLDKQKSLLKTEMTTHVEIVIAQKEHALLVPSEAVSKKEGQSIVMVIQKAENPQERMVKTGLNDGIQTEIESGLKIGEMVLLSRDEEPSRWRNPKNNSANRARQINRMMRGRH